MPPAEILHHADVHLLDDRGTRAEAIAWSDGKVLAVGSQADVERVAGEGATSYDAKGRTVLPGFVDAHHHPAIVALYGGTLQLTAPLVTDMPSMQRAISAASRAMDEAGASDDDWLVVVNWDEANLKERRGPTRQELDDAAPNRPLFAVH